jgi:hypothetical protein
MTITKRKRGRPRKHPIKLIKKEEEIKEESKDIESDNDSFEDNSFKKDESSLGIFQHSKLVEGSGSYFNSEKIIIVGGSGAGKSTLCSNIMVYVCKKFSHVVLITGSCDDSSYLLIKKLCESNQIPFTILSSEGDENGNIVTPMLKNCLLIFDDLQKSNGSENKVIKNLISNVFIRGRHDKTSTIWCCHSLKFIPDLVKNSCNMLFVDRSYDNIPYTQDIVTKNKWYMLNSFLNPSFCKMVEFKPLTIQHINRRLESKIHKEDRGKKLATTTIKYGIMKAGNDSKELKKDIDSEIKKETKKIEKNDCESTESNKANNDDILYKMSMERNYY